MTPPTALQSLLALTDDDERILSTASELADLVAPRVRESVTEQLDATASAPPAPQAVVEVRITRVWTPGHAPPSKPKPLTSQTHATQATP